MTMMDDSRLDIREYAKNSGALNISLMLPAL
jgi:hypothetical protein